MARNISTALNDLWDEAWNVVVAELADALTDLVVCGYAFRNHWFWINNYHMFSYVIWKDYNGDTWVSFDSSNNPMGTDDPITADNLVNTITPKINSAFDLEKPNIWPLCRKAAIELEAFFALTTPVIYSIVAFHDPNSVTRFGAYFRKRDSGHWMYKSLSLFHQNDDYSSMIFAFETRLDPLA